MYFAGTSGLFALFLFVVIVILIIATHKEKGMDTEIKEGK